MFFHFFNVGNKMPKKNKQQKLVFLSPPFNWGIINDVKMVLLGKFEIIKATNRNMGDYWLMFPAKYLGWSIQFHHSWSDWNCLHSFDHICHLIYSTNGFDCWWIFTILLVKNPAQKNLFSDQTSHGFHFEGSLKPYLVELNCKIANNNIQNS